MSWAGFARSRRRALGTAHEVAREQELLDHVRLDSVADAIAEAPAAGECRICGFPH